MTQENRRSFFRTLALGSATFAAALACGNSAQASEPTFTGAVPSWDYGSYSVTLERPGAYYGGEWQSFWHNGGMYVAGEMGERYNIRVHNHTGRRVEAVVAVDGRDVLSGKVGNYKNQRGYVIEPYGSVVVEGFRQSLDHVAAFRFTAQSQSYSARMGTPQNVGVIGVAVFEERAPKQTRRNNRPVQPGPYPRPYYDGAPDTASRDASAPAADEAAPPHPSGRTKSGGSGAAAQSEARGGYQGNVRPYYEPEKLGTEYGESTYSSVREVSFTRKSKNQPDAILTIYYDSIDGLRARGVPVDPPVYSYPQPYYQPEPFPEPQYAPPPPPKFAPPPPPPRRW